MNQHVGPAQAGADVPLQLVGQLVGAPEGGAVGELDVHVDVPAAAGPARAQLVEALQLHGPVRFKRLLDGFQLGGAWLSEVAYGWKDLDVLLSRIDPD